MDIIDILLIFIILISLYLVFYRCNNKQPFDNQIYTPLSIQDYKLTDKGCWVDNQSGIYLNNFYYTISPTCLDMRKSSMGDRGTVTIFDAYVENNIFIRIPDNLFIDTNNPSLSSSIESWNAWALTICYTYGFDTVGYKEGYKIFFGKKYSYMTTMKQFNYNYEKFGKYTNTCNVFGGLTFNHVYSVEIVNKQPVTNMIDNYLKFPGACRTDKQNNYPPWTPYSGLTLNECELKSRNDSNSTGFGYDNSGNCQIFDPTNPTKSGTVPSKTPIITGNNLTQWNCYIKPKSNYIYYNIYAGVCRTRELTYPPWASYSGMTFNECEMKSRYDNKSSGFSYDYLGNCQIFDPTNPTQNGTAVSGTELSTSQYYKQWKCYIKTPYFYPK